jgi:quinol monooxygenase YgiN
MVIVAGSIFVDPAHVAHFQEAVVPLAQRTRKEDGCLHYTLAVDNAESGEIVVLERWRDEPALRAHLATDHVKAFLDKVGGFVKSMDARLYDVSNERDVVV